MPSNLARDPPSALDHVERIRSAVLVLNDHPEIGRRTGKSPTLRALIISHGSSGYVALYEYSPVTGSVRILATLHQTEAGYASGQ